jgi:hypothetical protein
MFKNLLRNGVVAAAVALLSLPVSAQVSFDIPVTVTSGTLSNVLHLGVNPANTIGIDNVAALGAFQEVPQAPLPPGYDLSARFYTWPGAPAGLLGTTGLVKDFRPFVSGTQVDSFFVGLKTTSGFAGNAVTISWPAGLSTNGTAWEIKTLGGTAIPSTNMLTSTSVTIPADAFTSGYNVLIIKTGAAAPSPGPTFSASAVHFGTVGVGVPVVQNLVVTNTGSLNAMTITAISAGAAPFTYTVPGLPVTLNAGASLTIPVTFTPAAGGSFSGSVTFTHSAPGSPTSVALDGTGASSVNVLRFSDDPVAKRLDGYTYEDSLKLNLVGSGKLTSLQFALVSERPITLISLSKLSAFATGSWSFRSQFYRGNSTGDPVDPSVKDSIVVTIFANNRSTFLAPGTDYSMFKFQYQIDKFDAPDTLYRKLAVAYLIGSDSLGNNLGLLPDTLSNIQIVNSTVRGDVNNDGRVDILDLLKVVDHILLKKQLAADELARADVAPWNAPDGKVDARDLAVIQNMILTGLDLDGIRLNKVIEAPPVAAVAEGLMKTGEVSAYDAEVKFHVTANGIAVRMSSTLRVKGIQFDVEGLTSVPANMQVQSVLAERAYDVNTERVRVLVYDNNGASLDAGQYIIANLPLSVRELGAVKVGTIIVATEGNVGAKNINVQITFDEAPELPVDYSLKQNFPNPFNPTTDVQFSVPETGTVKIQIYNTLGQEVRTLFTGTMERGTRVVRFDGRDNNGSVLPTGTYIYRMSAGSFVESKKMMLLK